MNNSLYNEYVFQLGQAYVAAQRALDVLYEEDGPKRSFWHRWALGRAHSTLLSLYVKEKKNEDRRN